MLSPIHRVLSELARSEVKSLLMGGQACVLYGAAEFSRDVDVAVLADEENLGRLGRLIESLEGGVIAVPRELGRTVLERGHAVHFRCHRKDVAGIRLDVMTRMRGVDDFDALWERRTTFELEGVGVDVLALPDLVRAKKTQRDKDWPMIRRLLEAHYHRWREEPTFERIEFWLAEMRSPELLAELVERFPAEAARSERREIFAAVADGPVERVAGALSAEEARERAADARYWAPLREELAQMRRAKK